MPRISDSTGSERSRDPSLGLGLELEIEDLVEVLEGHELYAAIAGRHALRAFMRSHVFCVWDFMSLLAALRRTLACVSVPWLPTPDAEARRLINEVALDEESDRGPDGRHLSHFEMYLEAMRDCGADTAPIHEFIRRLSAGTPLAAALASPGIPPGVAAFVSHTMDVATRGEPHVLVAVFAASREWVIPKMFRLLVARLDDREPARWGRLAFYLERHLHLDGGTHSEAARALLERLCDGPDRRREAVAAARRALQARIDLWSAIRVALPVSTPEAGDRESLRPS